MSGNTTSTNFPNLPPNTIMPDNYEQFVQYFNRTYEDVAFAINQKDNSFYPMAIGSTAINIVNLANFGAWIICVSGADSTLPTLTASLCKADATASGSIAVLGSQAGTGAWGGNALTITSTASFFQIKHNRSGVMGSFNIRFIGTQVGFI